MSETKESMTIKEIVAKDTQTYMHSYMEASRETVELTPPKQLTALTALIKDDSAIAIQFDDGTLGIEINGKVWAVENYNADHRPSKRLPSDVWAYIRLAMR